jgi:hypothetical protein
MKKMVKFLTAVLPITFFMSFQPAVAVPLPDVLIYLPVRLRLRL